MSANFPRRSNYIFPCSWNLLFYLKDLGLRFHNNFIDSIATTVWKKLMWDTRTKFYALVTLILNTDVFLKLQSPHWCFNQFSILRRMHVRACCTLLLDNLRKIKIRNYIRLQILHPIFDFLFFHTMALVKEYWLFFVRHLWILNGSKMIFRVSQLEAEKCKIVTWAYKHSF